MYINDFINIIKTLKFDLIVLNRDIKININKIKILVYIYIIIFIKDINNNNKNFNFILLITNRKYLKYLIIEK